MTPTGTSDASSANPGRSGLTKRWPETIRKPPAEVRLVYLDLNQWIMLSKAMAGHREGARHQAALEVCLRAANSGTVVFPLSDSTYGEVAKIGQHRQRRALREVMELLSDYYVVMSRSDITAHEVEYLLDRVLGPSQSPVSTMDYLDRGVARVRHRRWLPGTRRKRWRHHGRAPRSVSGWIGGFRCAPVNCRTDAPAISA